MCSAGFAPSTRPCSSVASPSPFTPTRPEPSGFFRSTSSRASCTALEWERVERGIAQRVRALNAFLYDVYHGERILGEKKVPRELVYSSKGFNREMIEVDVPRDIYIHVSGIDLIRDPSGAFLVLEDNCRTPSGISYVLENRDALKRGLPDLFTNYAVHPVDDYPNRLLDVLALHGAARGTAADRRRADARHLQLRLFRTHAARAPDGCRTGRGARPAGRRQLRLSQDHERAANAST